MNSSPRSLSPIRNLSSPMLNFSLISSLTRFYSFASSLFSLRLLCIFSFILFLFGFSFFVRWIKRGWVWRRRPKGPSKTRFMGRLEMKHWRLKVVAYYYYDVFEPWNFAFWCCRLGLRLLARVKPSEMFFKSIPKDVTAIEVTYPARYHSCSAYLYLLGASLKKIK